MTPVRLSYPIPCLGLGACHAWGRGHRPESIGRDHRDHREPTGEARLSSTAGRGGVPGTFPFPSRWGPSPLRAGAIHPGRKHPAPPGPSDWLDRAPRSDRCPGGIPAKVCPRDGVRREAADGTEPGGDRSREGRRDGVGHGPGGGAGREGRLRRAGRRRGREIPGACGA